MPDTLWRLLADWCVPAWALEPWGDFWWPLRDGGF